MHQCTLGQLLDKKGLSLTSLVGVSEDQGMAPNYAQDILALLAERGTDKTICPSEVLMPHEKKNPELMEEVREAARLLVKQEKIIITQKGKEIDPDHIRGPIRLKLKP